MIFDKERHEPILKLEWSEEKARDVIKDIYTKAISSFDSTNYWSKEVNEDSEVTSNKTVYYGAAGTLWALDQIADFADIKLDLDKKTLIDDIYEKYISFPDTREVVPSIFLGESGILLIQYKYNPSKMIEDRLFKIIKENIQNVTLEPLWGASGTMLAASYMYGSLGSKKWADLFIENAVYLIDELKKSISREELTWTQDMYDQRVRYIGAGHGYFGNMFGILKHLDLLSEEDKKFILDNISETAQKLAQKEGSLTNWPAIISEKSKKYPLVQWCHGSPGIITSLESYPLNHCEYIENLLLNGGELTWQAGPLIKGVSLCHGTDGNGYAFLQLYRRTGDSLWLERARSFAMHAITQRNNNFTLFTGELGLGMYLISCIKEDSRFPFLDFI
jgi:hypothetical protein